MPPLSPPFLSCKKENISYKYNMFICLIQIFLKNAAYLIIPLSVFAHIPTLQSMAAGTSGPSGPCAAASARSCGAESAAPRRPDTGGRCARGTVRPPRTAQTGCVPRVRPFSRRASSLSWSSPFSAPSRHHVCTHANTAKHHKHV